MRVMLFMKPLKQYFAASVGLLAALQRGAVPAAAAAVLHAVSRQTSVTRDAAGGAGPPAVGPEEELADVSHEYDQCMLAPQRLPVPVASALALSAHI